MRATISRSKAALIAGLDLVISVDTSNAHLAGALGKPVWMLLPFAPDWRWGLEPRRQPVVSRRRTAVPPAALPGDWASVVAEVRAALVAHQTPV